MAGRQREEEDGAWLSIGALSRATGIAVETLRTWESRYGFPVPERKPSGHRVYPVSAVARLRRIAQALALGHRAGQVVGASDDALDRLLATSTAPQAANDTAGPGLPPVEDLAGQLKLIKAFDGERLSRSFLSDWARMGPVDFLETNIAPLVRAVGDAWKRGDIEIRHEHFFAERLGDVLRSLRIPREERAAGPMVAFATLPGEAHGLGLLMAALVLATAGCRILYLGTEVPIPQIASLARDLQTRAVAISISSSSKGSSTAGAVRRLRHARPRRTLLVTGGDGAPSARAGIDSIVSLRELDAWGRRIAAGLPIAAGNASLA